MKGKEDVREVNQGGWVEDADTPVKLLKAVADGETAEKTQNDWP